MLKWAVYPKPREFRKRNVISVPKRSTRSKIQSRRSSITMDMNKELHLRTEAESEYCNAHDKTSKENAELNLNITNYNIQLLKEQLSLLNTPKELSLNVMPMISLGLKETKELNLMEPLKNFIKTHYHECSEEYEDSIAELMDIRQSMRSPLRDCSGISLLFQYFNQLELLEKRFIDSETSSLLCFEWYDSLCGVPSQQRDMSMEKASVLFNAGALSSQVGGRQDRTSAGGLEAATEHFLSAAGIFQFILDNYSDVAARDLEHHTLQLLVQLMCAQARETGFQKLELQLEEDDDDGLLQLGQEAADVSLVYDALLETAGHAKYQVPSSWLCMVQVKQRHYLARADYYVATALLRIKGEVGWRERDKLGALYEEGEKFVDLQTSEEKLHHLGKAHLRESLLTHEEAVAILKTSVEIRNKDVFLSILQRCLQNCLQKYEDVDQEDDFQELPSPPCILPHSSANQHPAYPVFHLHPPQDLFQALGPVETFSARRLWDQPRIIHLVKQEGGSGFSLRGKCPPVVSGLEHGSTAQVAGLKNGDYLVNVGSLDVRWDGSEQVLGLIKVVEEVVRLRVITPCDRDHSKKFCKNQFFKIPSISVPKIFTNSIASKPFESLSYFHNEESFSSSSEFSTTSSERSQISWTETVDLRC